MLTEDPSQPLLVSASHNLILSLEPSLTKTVDDTVKRLEKVRDGMGGGRGRLGGWGWGWE